MFGVASVVADDQVTYILRDRPTLFFALLIPILQLFFLGYAVDTNVRQVPTVLWLNALTLTSRARPPSSPLPTPSSNKTPCSLSPSATASKADR